MEPILHIIGGFAALLGGAELLVRGSAAIAKKLGLSPLVIGLTVVAFGTSSPELVVSLSAALNGNPDIALGNVIGSNICNIALILGITSLIYPLSVSKQVIRKEIPIAIAAALLMLLGLIDASLMRWEGLILSLLLIAYLSFSYYASKKESLSNNKQSSGEVPAQKQMAASISVIFVIAGLLLLAFGSEYFVKGAVVIATELGISNAVIGLTVVALGTSLPELVTSIVAAVKRQTDIAIGNVIGSNIFNILGILGITSLVTPIHANNIRQLDLFIMIGISLLLLPFARTGFRLNRVEGSILLVIYFIYVYSLLP